MTSVIAPISTDSLSVSYVNNIGTLIEGASIADANEYARLNPQTTFLFLDGDNNYRYLNIDQVNQLTPLDLISTKSVCDTTPKPCGVPKIVFSGGDGIGAKANPIISPNGALLAIDVVSPGVGYTSSNLPSIRVVDNCNIGSGAVVQATVDNGSVSGGIVLDSGSSYIPAQEATSTYPALLSLKEVIVNSPGINYNPGVDVVEITPNNGTVLQASFTPFGQVASVKVVRPGIGFTSRPNITIRSESGVNADFTPVFEIIRDPEVLDPQIQQRKILTVIDISGLTLQGFIGGKPYYGNIYYDNGVKYAGPYKSFDTQIRVYDTLPESIK
jgi:hypothetical protein